MGTVTSIGTRPKGNQRTAPPPEPPVYGGDGEPERFRRRLRLYRLGVGVGLMAVLMLFVSFSSALIVRQGLGNWDAATGLYRRDWRSIPLPRVLMLSTLVLLASSVCAELARRRSLGRAKESLKAGLASAERKSAPWLGYGIGLGVAFLAGQIFAWRSLLQSGLHMYSGPASAFFYLLTATHALHLVGGLIALVYAGWISAFSLDLRRGAVLVDAASWYWHAMAILWIYLYALLLFGT